MAISDRFDVSREAALRRYVDLHEEKVAALFTKRGRVRYVEKARGYPPTVPWRDDQIARLPGRPANDLSSVEEVDPQDWIRGGFRGAVFGQTPYQRDGFAMTLPVAKPQDEAG